MFPKYRRRVKKKIGEILLEAEAITKEELNNALKRQKGNGECLGKNLVDLGYLDEDEITQYLAEQYRIPCVALDRYRLSANLEKTIPEDISKTYGLIPLDLIGDILTVGIVDVPDGETIRRLEELTGLKVQVMLITPGDFNRYIQKVYNLSVVYNDKDKGFQDTEVGKYVKMPSYQGRERRRSPRFNSELRIKYEIKDEYNINSSINISRCGVLIKSKSPVPVNSHLVVKMELPTSYEDIIIISRVVRVERVPDEDIYLIALNFSSMEANDSIKLSRFIKTLK